MPIETMVWLAVNWGAMFLIVLGIGLPWARREGPAAPIGPDDVLVASGGHGFVMRARDYQKAKLTEPETHRYDLGAGH